MSMNPAQRADIIGGYDLGEDYPHLKNHMLIAVTETNNKQEIDDLVTGLKDAAEQLYRGTTGYTENHGEWLLDQSRQNP